MAPATSSSSSTDPLFWRHVPRISEVSDARTGGGGWQRWLGAGVFVAAGMFVQLFRSAGQHNTDTIWAEDGAIFASDAYTMPAAKTLLRGYAGYAQFLPRVLALGVRVVPVASLARYEATVAAATWALLALFVHRSTAGWIRSPWLRWLLAALVVASPTAAIEADAAITNLGWVLVIAAFWAVVSNQQAPGDVVLRCVVVAVAVLSTPLTLVVVPMAVVVFNARRRVTDLWVGGALVAACAIQAVVIHTTPSPASGGSWTISDLLTEFGVRGVAASVFGERWLETLWLTYGYALVAAAVIVIALLVIVAWPGRRGTDHLLFAAGAVATSLLTLLVTVVVHGSSGLRLTADHFELGGARYYIVPVLLLVTAIIVVADASQNRWVAPAVVVAAAIILVSSFGETTVRSNGPSWAAGIDQATVVCRAPSAPETVAIPISPSGWFVVVPCTRLL